MPYNAFDPHCDFCGKCEAEGVRLIAGPRAKICNECVQLCSDIFADRRTEEPFEFPPSEPLEKRLKEYREHEDENE